MVTDQSGKAVLEEKVLSEAFDIVDTVQGGNCEVTLEYDLTVDCPHDDAVVDEYDVTITYFPADERCLEIQSVRELLDRIEDVSVGQEGLTAFLAHFLFAHISPKWIEVEVAGEHYGINTTTSKRREE